VELTAAELADRLDGEVEGNANVAVRGLASLVEAREGDVSFLAQRRYESQMAETGASAVFVERSWKGTCPAVLIRVHDPDVAFANAAALFAPVLVARTPGVHPTAVVADGVKLGADVHIGPHCVIEPGAEIGDRTVLCAGCFVGEQSRVGADGFLYSRVSIRERVRIGDRVILHNGVVIGSDGFGYGHDGSGWVKIPQIGTVEIGNDVEIGANSTIDRARFGRTVIEDGVKIDNLVQVAHNCRIGQGAAIAALVGIAGSTEIGASARLGGQAGVAGHLQVGDGVVVAGGAGVTKSIPPNTFVSGFPAMPHNKARRLHAHMMRLPNMRRQLEDLVRRLGAIENAVDDLQGGESA
jgi:UDP-3-O-[3-hydroxymyristoyl] glucosamine N-acyltransferase